jgi:23S rRNA maturation-related 3'-5' exoribonuclease YhaM
MKEIFGNMIASLPPRAGLNSLYTFLCNSDFLTAPCSTRFHLACKGGLAKHTLNVINIANEVNRRYDYYPVESVIIAALGHDFCKVNF